MDRKMEFFKRKKNKSLIPKSSVSDFINTSLTATQIYSFFIKPTPKQFFLLTSKEQSQVMKNRILEYLYENQDEYVDKYVLENIFVEIFVKGSASRYEEVNLDYSTKLAEINEVIAVLLTDGLIKEGMRKSYKITKKGIGEYESLKGEIEKILREEVGETKLSQEAIIIKSSILRKRTFVLLKKD
jgi:hypothetical protein